MKMTPLLLNDPDLLRTQCFIDGQWVAADNQASIAVTNPATGELIAHVPNMGAVETRRAIAAAHAALPAWRQKTAMARADLLKKWHALIVAHQDDLATIMTSEQGKPLTEAKGEIIYAASFIEWFAEEGKRVYGDIIPAPKSDNRILVTKAPVGVCAAITPWNFPAAMITRKAGAALAAGCTMVIKPASLTPLTALALMTLAQRAGIPAGVLSMVTGTAQIIAAEMTSNPLVRKLSFTGSTETGIALLKACAPTVKKTSMELGGNAPFIVFDDADIDAAVAGAMLSKFRNAGQTCVCANRIYVQDAIFDQFTSKLAQAVSALKIGNGLDPGVTQGPMINQAAVEKVEALIADATRKGATIVTGGTRHALDGYFFMPTILTEINDTMQIAHEEIFGPVATLFRFKTESAVIAMANDTAFGLAAYFYANDLSRVWRVAEALEYGMVGVNTGAISNEMSPFGGIKASGMGREGSKYGIEDYLELKYLCLSIQP